MSESFADVMNQAFSEAEGDTAPATPDPPVETPPETSEAPQSETPADAGEAAFLGDEKFDWKNVPPDLLPLAKQFQADYTRKTQEIAEQRKQLDGIDPGTLSWTQYLQNLSRTNPAAAADLLRQEAERLGQPARAPLVDEYATENERRLAAEHQQVMQELQQLKLANLQIQVDRRFADLESQYGTKIPQEERARLLSYCAQRQIQDVGDAWKILNFDRIRQQGRDEASTMVQRKSQMAPPPGGVAPREQPAAREPRSVREALEMAIDEAG